jgi:DinB family protein
MTQPMTPPWKSALEHQYVAALDMLENAIRACPEAVWDDTDTPVPQRFWYLAYHTLFWLDFYLAEREQGFAPPAPYTLDELDPAGVYPGHAYAKSELLTYLAHGRDKLGRAFLSLTEARAAERCGFASRKMSVFELRIYDMRHVQHHTAQLNLILRQRTDSAPRWVG